MSTAPTAGDPSPTTRPAAEPDPSPALVAAMATGWAAPTPQLSGVAPVARYAARRRAALVAELPTLTLVVPAGTAPTRTGDQPYHWRPASSFLHLVGAAVPGGVLVCGPGGDRLYAPDPAPRSERAAWAARDGSFWEGPQPRLAEWGEHLELPVRPLGELAADLARTRWVALAPPTPYPFPTAGRREWALEPLAAALAAEARLTKDAYELGELGLAVHATGTAFTDLARELHAGVAERWLEGSFTRRARTLGEACGYAPIVAAGPHACTLHWSRNDGTVRAGELVLVDAGVELASGYTADVTRVLPTAGRFDATQREVVAAVAAAQAAGIAAVRPDAPFTAAHDAAMAVLAERLCAWGLLAGSVDEVLGRGLHRRFTLHGTSHMLGLDVHDCASARADRYRGPLARDMVLTVEPGLYFQPDDTTVPSELAGLGVRLEDDVVVGSQGPEVLDPGIPADPAALEAWLARLR